MSNSLSGRRALVTGASGGIGGAIAVGLAEAGADVTLTYSGHREDADNVAQRITGPGRHLLSRIGRQTTSVFQCTDVRETTLRQ